MNKSAINLLTDIEVSEVSLVDKAANKRKFLLYKAENNLEELSMMEAILKAVSEVKLDNEAKIDETVEKAKLSEKKETIHAVLRVIKSAELPKEFIAELVTLAGGELPTVEIEKIVEKIVEVEKKSDADKAEELKKEALGKLTDEQKAVFEKALEIAKSAEERVKALDADLKKEQDLRKLTEVENKIKGEYTKLPATSGELALLFKNAEGTLRKEDFELFTRLMKAANEALNRSEDFNSAGSSLSGDSGNAYNKVVNKAKELQKANVELTLATAIEKVLLNEPALYNEYIKEGN